VKGSDLTSKPIRLFSTDLDGTILGDEESAKRFKAIWPRIPAGHRPLLCYNSGRLLDDIHQLVQAGLLPDPDYIIGGVGTQVFDFAADLPLSAFTQTLKTGWDRNRVEDVVLAAHLPITRQPGYYQTPFKSSWTFHNATPNQLAGLRLALAQAGLDISLIYSSHQDLDILPKGADKGKALTWLADTLKISLAQVLVAGDTGNDSAMFALDGVRGIVPGNGHADLIAQAQAGELFLAASHEVCADGVLAGLRHYGVVVSSQYLVGERN